MMHNLGNSTTDEHLTRAFYGAGTGHMQYGALTAAHINFGGI